MKKILFLVFALISDILTPIIRHVFVVLIMLLSCISVMSQCYELESIPFSIGTNGGNTNANYQTDYILTTFNDEILEISSNATFTGQQSGAYKVYAVNYEILSSPSNLEIGNNIDDIQGDCMDISASLPINICKVDCDIFDGEYNFNSTGGNLDNYTTYLLVNSMFEIIDTTSLLTFSGIPEGDFLVYAINHSSDFEFGIGNSVNDISLFCYDISDPITVKSCPSCEIYLGDDFEICESMSVILSSSTTSQGTYLWNTGSTTSTITVIPDSSTIYSVTITDALGCQATDSILVSVLGGFEVSIDGVSTICEGESTTLTASGGTTYQWYGGASSTSAAITVSPSSTTTYNVLVIDDNNCSESESITVIVDDCALCAIYDCDIECGPYCDGVVDFISTGGNTSNITEYLITNEDGEILGISNESQFQNLSSGLYFIWAINYEAGSEVNNNTVGSNILDVNGSCLDISEPFIVRVCEPSPLDIISTDSEICEGFSTTLVAQTTESGTYLWSTGATTSEVTVSPLVTTNYSVTFTNVDGCASIDEQIITVNTGTPVTITGDLEICENTSTTLMANTGSTGTYLWSTGATNPTITVSPSANTSYSVTFTDTNGCETTDQVEVLIGTGSSVSIVGELEVCEGLSTTLQAQTTESGTYLWSTGATTSEITVSPLVTTNYSVTFTNTDGCESIDEQTVTVNIGTPVTIIGDLEICENTSTTLTANTGSTGTYLWSTGATNPAITVSPTVNTSYSVTFTDTNGCETIDQVEVLIGTGSSVSIVGELEVCEGLSTTLQAQTTESGTYLWSTGATTSEITVSPLVTTNYSVTFTNADGCESIDEQTVTVNTGTPVTIIGDLEICENTSTTLTANTGSTGTYLWSTGATSAAITVSPSVNTSYSVTFTDGNGCQTTSTEILSVNELPTLMITGEEEICSGSSGTLNVTGAISYIWMPGNLTGSSITVSPITTTTYTITGTDSNGCQATESITVIVDDCALCAIYDCDIECGPYCDGVVDFITTGGNTSNTTEYLITNEDGEILGISNESQFQNLSSGLYFIWAINYEAGSEVNNNTVGSNILDVNGSCLDISEPFIVRVCEPSPLDIISTDSEICEGFSTTLVAQTTESGTYLWSTGATTSEVTVSPLVTTNYSVTFTNVDGCASIDEQIITVNTGTPVTITGDLEICENTSTTLMANTGSTGTYLWSTGATNPTITVSPSANTSYSVTFTDTNGCETTDQVEVLIGTGSSVSIVGELEVCEGLSTTLQAQTTESGTYLWSTGATTSEITVSPLVTTNYSVTFTNTEGCESIDEHAVAVNSGTTVTISGDLEICENTSTTLTANTGSTGTYLWSTGATNPAITVSPTVNTSYSVTFTDTNGCETIDQVEVLIGTGSSVSIVGELEVCEGLSTTLFAQTIETGTYLWSTGATTSEITVSPLETKNYSVTFTNTEGCASIDEKTVNVNQVPQLEISMDATICNGDEIILTANGANEYVWMPGSLNGSSNTVAPTQTTTYIITGTSEEGCETVEQVTIFVEDCMGSIGDQVWLDVNQNGINDDGNTGVEGVTVSLMDCFGSTIQSTTTDATGFYLFNNLDSGDYQVSIEAPSGYTITSQNVGSDDFDSDINQDGNTDCFTLGPNEIITNVDAGLIFNENSINIGDFVWVDIDGDGLQDLSEPGISGVEVQLYTETGQLVSVTTTDSNGKYLFTNVVENSYYIIFVDPSGFTSTFPNEGNDNVDSDITNFIESENGSSTDIIIVTANSQDDLSIDAGYYECVNIGENVWYDNNKNDIFDDTENGINGLHVQLYRLESQGFVLYEDMTTGHKPNTPSDDGYFNFCAPPGTYYVEVVLPPIGLVHSIPNVLGYQPLGAPNESSIDSDITNSNGFSTTESFSVLSGDNISTIGAGFYPMGTIGNSVWIDSNGNNSQDDDEQKVSGVLVEAFDENDVKIGEDVTDDEGLYKIEYLKNQSYYLKFSPPAGYDFITPHQGDDSTDSDVDNSNGPNTTALVIAVPGEDILDIDAGINISTNGLFASISAEWVGSFNKVQWVVNDQSEIVEYTLQRKHEFEDSFTDIVTIPAKDKSEQNVHYRLDDYDIERSGSYYYRLKIVTEASDATPTFSLVVFTTVDELMNEIDIYPNPSDGELTLSVKLSGAADAEVMIFDVSGRLVQNHVLKTKNGRRVEEVIQISGLIPGVYFVRLRQNKFVEYQKIIVSE